LNQTYVTSAGWSRKVNRVIRTVHPSIVKIVKESSDEVLKATIKNVSGPGIRPGVTRAENNAIGQMPIPRRTKQLIHSIKRLVIYNWLHAVFSDPNIAPHGKYVHDGTRRARPRRFLGDVMTEKSRKIYSQIKGAFLMAMRKEGLR